jgi:hypothetical protein
MNPQNLHPLSRCTMLCWYVHQRQRQDERASRTCPVSITMSRDMRYTAPHPTIRERWEEHETLVDEIMEITQPLETSWSHCRIPML